MSSHSQQATHHRRCAVVPSRPTASVCTPNSFNSTKDVPLLQVRGPSCALRWSPSKSPSIGFFSCHPSRKYLPCASADRTGLTCFMVLLPSSALPRAHTSHVHMSSLSSKQPARNGLLNLIDAASLNHSNGSFGFSSLPFSSDLPYPLP